jgi:hypothetical protein
MKRVWTGLGVVVLFCLFTGIAYVRIPEPITPSPEKVYSGQRHAGISVDRAIEASPTVTASR